MAILSYRIYQRVTGEMVVFLEGSTLSTECSSSGIVTIGFMISSVTKALLPSAG